jgi:hypothetical protein
MIQPVSTGRSASTVAHAPVALSMSLYWSTGSGGRSLVVCCPRFVLRVEDRVAIAQKFSPNLSGWCKVTGQPLLLYVWPHSGRSSDRVTLHDTRCMHVDITGMWYSGEVSRSQFVFQRNNLVPFAFLVTTCLCAFVHTKMPSAYNPVVNNLPASGSHRPVVELGNRLPSLINTVWTE